VTASATSSPFAKHLVKGLNAHQAFISSRFIYDERGSKLFQQIMQLEEYYLTRSEHEILAASAITLHKRFSHNNTEQYELIELGAGDGAKTKLLLAEAVLAGAKLVYRPVDISPEILEELSKDLAQRWPQLQVDPIAASYDDALKLLRKPNEQRRAVLFLGSNIGNFSLPEARKFCRTVGESLQTGDLFLIGVDLRKDPRKILSAYDDSTGVTAQFNLNLLHRANRDVGANFNVDAWGFYPLYNPETGEVRSYLYPRSEQRVQIPQLEIDRTFLVGDTIHTEVSRKYSRAELDSLANAAGFDNEEVFTDSAGNFADALWVKQ